MHQLSLMASQMNFTDALGCEMSGKGARRRRRMEREMHQRDISRAKVER